MGGYVVLLALSICAAAVAIASAQGMDLTLEEGERGTDVVLAVISKIEAWQVFPTDNRLLRRMAYVESRDGNNPSVDLSAGGIWQIDEDQFMETQTSDEANDKVSDFVDWRNVDFDDLQIPLYSGLAARLYLYHLSTQQNVDIPAAGDIRGQAEFWNEYLNEDSIGGVEIFENAAEMLELEDDCAATTDLIFVIDSSGSIGFVNFMKVLQFVHNFVEPLDIGPDKNRVGFIIFSSAAKVVFNLSTYWDKRELLQAINETEYTGGETNTADALMTLIDVGFTEEAGARLNSQIVLRVAVVLTDGQSGNTHATITAANRVHAFRPGILVYVVGVTGSTDEDELQAIATQDVFIDHLTQFDTAQFQQSQEESTYQICTRASIPTDVGDEFSDILTEGQMTRLQVPIPVEGLTIRLCVESGHIVLYGSFSVPNPGPAFYDYRLDCIRQCGGCEIFVEAPVEVEGVSSRGEGRSRRQTMSGNETVSFTNTTLFILLEGVEENNTFTLANDIGDTTTTSVSTDKTLAILLGCIIPGTALVILLTAVVIPVLCLYAERRRRLEKAEMDSWQ